jgi:mannose-6-phosphate isomerase-like protein (cupin superfamily)
MRLPFLVIVLLAAACASGPPPMPAPGTAPAMVVIDEKTVTRDEPPPHGAIGMSTAFRISDAVPGRAMEFRKRTLHVGAAIGLHPIDHDEVYYVLEGEGDVTSDGRTERLTPGKAAYLYRGAVVGIRQVGPNPLTIIISYPLPPKEAPGGG